MNIRIVLAVAIAIVSVLAGATSQLDIIFGHTVATTIVAVCNLASAIMAGVIGVLSTQMSQIGSVESMPGVSKILVNEQATSDLAVRAVTPGNKVAAAPGAEQQVTKIAENAK